MYDGQVAEREGVPQPDNYPTMNQPQSFSSSTPSVQPFSSLSSDEFLSPQYPLSENSLQNTPNRNLVSFSSVPPSPCKSPAVPSVHPSAATSYQQPHPSALSTGPTPQQNFSSNTCANQVSGQSLLVSPCPQPPYPSPHPSASQSAPSSRPDACSPLQKLSSHSQSNLPCSHSSTNLETHTSMPNVACHNIDSLSCSPSVKAPLQSLSGQTAQLSDVIYVQPSTCPSVQLLNQATPNRSNHNIAVTSNCASAHLTSRTPMQNLTSYSSGLLPSQTGMQNQSSYTSPLPTSQPSGLLPSSSLHPPSHTPMQNRSSCTAPNPSACLSDVPSGSYSDCSFSSKSHRSTGANSRKGQPSGLRLGLPSQTSGQLSQNPYDLSYQALHRHGTVSDSESDMVQEDVTTLRQRQEDISDIDSQVYLSVVWQTGRLGLAYYDIDNMLIHIMLDTDETDSFTVLRRALRQLQPGKVVASSKQDERLVKFLRQSLARSGDDAGRDSEADVLHFLPNVEFSIEICKRRLLSLNLPSLPDHYNDAERTIYMSSLVPFENVCVVRAAGGLLKFLEKMRVGVELEDTDTRVPVMGIQIFTLENQMIVDDTAYSALQIFYREAHPSVYKSGSGSKEGLSLFGILNRCRSQIGSKMLRLWFLRPLKNIDMLRQRHEAIEFFVQSRNIEVLSTLTDCLKHIRNVPRILSRMLQAQASVGDWQALYKTAYYAVYIRDVCRTQPQHLDIFKKISTGFSEGLRKIATLINRIVDFDQSAVDHRFVVKTNVDPELDEKKRTYNGLPDFMTKVAREELNRLSPDIAECVILYLPQIGYLLAIPETDSTQSYEIEGLEFIFVSNNTRHYKSASTRELDRLLGDTMCDITDHETSILHRLQNTILKHSDVLYVVMELAAELDCLMALATCAREFSYEKPELVKESVIDIKGGRHPLQELCCTPFVPNDYLSGRESGKVKVLTGPNACGKSVYLKQIALIVYMAQIGSFVPAEKAVIGVMDRIFTRVKSLESVSVGLSTFMLDINQMAESLRNATERSLVIVDEFGKGTELIDGLSLLCSCLKYWLAKKDQCPHVLMSTHFHSLVHQNMLPESDQLQFLTLESLHNGEELVFLYQVVEGHTTSSYASHTATQAGLPEDIVQRGTQVSDLLRQGKPVQRLDTADSSSQLSKCEKIVTHFLQLDLDNDNLKSFLKDLVLTVNKEKK